MTIAKSFLSTVFIPKEKEKVRGILALQRRGLILCIASLCFILLLPSISAFDKPLKEWDQKLGGKANDAGFACLQTREGGYIIVGSTASLGSGGDDVWIVKLYDNGSLDWSKAIGSSNDDRAYAVVEVRDGYVLAGYATAEGEDTNFLLVKTDTKGEVIWEKQYGGSGNDIATALIQTNDGGLAVAGYSSSSVSGKYAGILLKTDAEGSVEWSAYYGEEKTSQVFALLQTADGGYLLGGRGQCSTCKNYDAWVVKTNATGTLEWNQTYGSTGDESFYAVLSTDDGSYTFAGDTASSGAGHYDCWLVHMDDKGVMQWERTYGSKGEDSARALLLEEDGGFILGGYSKRLLSYDFYCIKTDAEGYVEWDASYGSADLFGYALIHTTDEGFLFAGIRQLPKDAGLFALKTGPMNETEFNKRPTVTVDADITIQQGESVSFEGEAYDPDGTIIAYEWDFEGDGLTDWNSTSSSLTSHTYETAGTYAAYLIVVDSNGSSVTAARKVTVTDTQTEQHMILPKTVWAGILFCIVFISTSSCLVLSWKKDVRSWLKNSRFRILERMATLDQWTGYLIFSIIALFLMKISLDLLFQTPKIYSDEHAYAAIAHDIFSGNLVGIGEIKSQIPITRPYPAGYSYFLAPAYLLGSNMSSVYQMMLAFNALLTSLLTVPVFFIMKLFVSKRVALLTGVLVALLPVVLTHNYLLMSENAFLLMFLVSSYLLIRTYTYKETNWKFGIYIFFTFVSIALLVAIKATGLAMLSAAVVLLYYKIFKHHNRQAFRCGCLALPILVIVEYILLTGKLSSIGYDVSIYTEQLALVFSDSTQFLHFLGIIINEFGYFILMSYLIFMIFTVFLLFYWKRIASNIKSMLSIFTLYGLLSIVFLTLISSAHISRGAYDIYTRYVSVGLPIIFMLGCIGGSLYLKIRSRDAGFHVGILLVVLGFLALFTFPLGVLNVVNNLDLAWITYLHSSPLFVVAIIGGPVLSYILLRQCIKKGKLKQKKTLSKKNYPLGTVVMLCMIVLSVVLAYPGLSTLVAVDNDIEYYGYNDPSQWIMKIDPQAHVIIEDAYSAFSGAGMSSKDWYFLYGSTLFWLPQANITVLNKGQLSKFLQKNNVEADFLLSTHDFTSYFPKIASFALPLSVAHPRRLDAVQWNLYDLT